MLKAFLFFSCLCLTFIESSEFKENEEVNFLIALEYPITSFLPYNPRILELGGKEGVATTYLATHFYKGTLFVFEPSEEKFIRLLAYTQKFKNVNAYNLSLNNSNKYSSKQPFLSLDEWCEQNKISNFDLIRFDSEGTDWSIIKNSPKILKTTLVISIKTSGSSIKTKLIIKRNLERFGFLLFPSDHQKKMGNELVFIRKEIYDSIFM